jgi:hypothetical protein
MKGRYFTLGEYENFRYEAGTTDKEILKAVFFETSAHYKIINGLEENLRTMKYFMFQLRRSLSELIGNSIFDPKFLMMSDIPDSFEKNAGGFVNIEITLFIKGQYELNFVKSQLKEILDEIHKKHYNQNDQILFSKISTWNKHQQKII